MCEITGMEYYEKAFERLEKEHKHTWNWAAFCFGVNWILYRKMYSYFFVWFFVWFIFLVIANIFEAGFIFTLITRVLLGYYGNYLYYQTVKKRISKGYHLLDKYRPTSIPSALLAILSAGIISFADYISMKLQLRDRVEQNTNVDAESIRSYLNPNRKNHWTVKIANVLICFLLLFMISVPIIKQIGAKIEQQLKEKQTVAMLISNTRNITEV